eukprot:symbB.v1.2.013056.t1/scaffold907.1/size153227/1
MQAASRSRSRSNRRHKKRRDKNRDRRHGDAEETAQPSFYGAFGYGGHHWPMPYGPVDEGVDVKVSSKFLTRNDYCQTFIDTGLRPQNFIRDLDYQNRYSEYPKIQRLIKLKDDILAKRASPGMSLKCDLKTFDLSSLGTKFDVVLLDPPWEEYQTRVAGMYVPDEDLSTWTLDELKALK